MSPGFINTFRVAGGGLPLVSVGARGKAPGLWRLCWNLCAGTEETTGSVVATQPYLRPPAGSPVPRRGLISLAICAPARLGTPVAWWVSLGMAAHLLEVRMRRARAGSVDREEACSPCFAQIQSLNPPQASKEAGEPILETRRLRSGSAFVPCDLMHNLGLWVCWAGHWAWKMATRLPSRLWSPAIWLPWCLCHLLPSGDVLLKQRWG